MTRRLPPLSQLRAFEAAARLGSFKAAAEELHVTHAAISHQIKALEDDLGRPLFRRITRGVELLPEAGPLLRLLGESFDAILQAGDELRRARFTGCLRVSSVPAFGYRFVLPRLAAFHAAHPGLSIDLSMQAGVVEIGEGGYDAGLRYGRGDWPGLDGHLIFRDNLAPLAAPTLLAGRAVPMPVDEVAALPFAVSAGSDTDWQNWFRQADIHAPDRPKPLQLENRAVVLDYTVSGSGIALIDLRFAAKELDEGALVRLHPATVEGVNGTYLVWRKTPVPDPRIKVFADWLTAQIGAVETA